MTELIFVVPGLKVNAASITAMFYSLSLSLSLSQQMLPAIKHVASDTFVFQQDNAPSHRSRTPLNSYSKNAGLRWPDLWPPNSPDLNLVNYKVWGVMQQRVYECHMNSVDELKLRVIDVWNSLKQNVIDAAINDWRKQLTACVHADGQHFEHLLRAHVTKKL